MHHTFMQAQTPTTIYGYGFTDILVHSAGLIQMKSQIPTTCIRKNCLNGYSKIDKTKILMTNGSLMKVESIAECSPWSILQYF